MQRSRQPRTPSQPLDDEAGVRVLVVYASRFGSTREIAERIGGRLSAQGLQVDVRKVDAADDIEPYDAIVFGSPIFGQRWLAEAETWIRRRRGVLSGYPTWLFSVGTFGDDRRGLGPLVRHEPRGSRALREVITPRDYRVFAGVIERDRWPWPSRLLYRACGGRFGDNRAWAEIDGWADSIAGSLRPARRSA